MIRNVKALSFVQRQAAYACSSIGVARMDVSPYWARDARVRRRGLLAGAAGSLLMAGCNGSPNPAGSSGATPGASGAGTPARGGTLTFAIASDISNLDPLKSSSLYDRRVQYQIYDSLISTDKDLKLNPGLALSWETSDPTSLVFKLRQGAKFQDGTDFNADAVKFNIDRILQTPSSPRNAEITGVDSAQVVDPATVKLSLRAPFSPLLAQLVDRSGMILSPAAINKLGDDLTRNPAGAGTGPFKFVEYLKDDHITLTRNETYWGKDSAGGALPYLDKLTIRPIPDETQRLNSLKTGEIDFADGVPYKDVANIKTDPSLVYSQIPALSFNGFWVNGAQDPFKDVRVRQALAWSVDRQQIIDTVYFKIPVVSNGPIAPPQFPYDSGYKPYTRDIAKAKALLSQAGRSDATFTMFIQAGSPTTQQSAELLKDQVKDAGFTLNIQPTDFPTLLTNLTKRSFQSALSGWSGRLDPDGNTYIQFHTDSPNNYAAYSNPAMDKALDDARLSFDQNQRSPLYKQVNKLAAEEAPYIFLYHDVTGQYSTAKVKHFTPVPDAVYRFFDVWKQS
jgi:peptide/nickel transport system substrate-binding protein